MCPSPKGGGQFDRSGYFSSATIAAVASALGGPISVLRISGPESDQALDRLIRRGWSQEHEPRKLFLSNLIDEYGAPLDQAMVVRFTAEQSYTGEASAELHLHGSPLIAARLMEQLAKLGVRQALPGEFSFRAVRNGKMTVTQAEAVSDLLEASNERAATLALEKMSGTQHALIGALAHELREVVVLSEAGIDFADQDIDEVSLERLKARISPVQRVLEKLKGSYERGARVQNGIRTALVGLPNAGKSSLFNALLGEDRSIVSDQAGTTRDIVRETLTLKGPQGSVTLRLEDTAGLRDSSDQVERQGVERSMEAVKRAEIVLFAVDISDATTKGPVWSEWKKLGSPSERAIGILTKGDLVEDAAAQSAAIERLKSLGIERWLITSATTGEGITQAAAAIADFGEKWIRREPKEVLLTRLDHVAAAAAAMQHLERAIEAELPDLFAADLRQALGALAPVIGDTPADDILGRIFSNFCIGK